MKLTESEGKDLLQKEGISIPSFFVAHISGEHEERLPYPVVLKAQTVTGSRGKKGLVRKVSNHDECKVAFANLQSRKDEDGGFETVRVEEEVKVIKEFYLSLTFDYAKRKLFLTASKFGGMNIETIAKRMPQSIKKVEIDPTKDFKEHNLDELIAELESPEELRQVIKGMCNVFYKNYCETLEINPLGLTKEGKLYALDTKIILDDNALDRTNYKIPIRRGFRPATNKEKLASQLNLRSHRGSVGSTYLELEGDIAFMASGGGASLTCFDALIHYGGSPANFVEYSGNPERQDVYELTKIVLDKPGLKGLWIVGPTANFTDVYETVGGIIDALKEKEFTLPVVIRRSGPRVEEAKQLVAEQKDLDITFLGEEISMTESAKILLDKIK